MLALARAAGYEPPSPATPPPARPAPPATGRCRRGRAAPFVVVHPGASVPARAPRPEDAAAIVAELVRRGRRVVVTGGPRSGADRGRRRRAAPDRRSTSAAAPICRRSPPSSTAADAVVVGNTGPAHLAAAVGTPVVSLFAPVVPLERWHPWGVPVRVLGEQQERLPGDGRAECPVPGHPCLASVPVQQVADAVAELAPAPATARRAVSA